MDSAPEEFALGINNPSNHLLDDPSDAAPTQEELNFDQDHDAQKSAGKKRTPFRAPMKKPRFPKPRDPNPLTAQIKAAEGDFQGALRPLIAPKLLRKSCRRRLPMPVWGRGAKWSA